ncbi:carbon monoxide dehydrogenase subunit G [Streptomyces sp. SID8379]|uniref:SRPBCC family protein n=1 Tax=unclassified Streptomyces TaxID=2593676 RepID=UPI000378CD37|nr:MULTISPECIES: SRPBCC family protein [unclassified Streptomyces]MYW68731.1 carbon monoxide dehydrogenase subunit G [Streptomyces sp. SID8379]
MEHEVFVPVPAESVRAVLSDPLRVARALPGFQRDASGDGGRLKVRIGGHTITYRGSVTVARAADGSFAVTGVGTEARGTGGVKFTLSARVAAMDGGAALTFTGTASGDGRVAELPRDAVESAAQRLLNRFAENLVAARQEPGTDPEAETEPDPEPEAEPAPEHVSVYETDVPPPSLDPEAEFGEHDHDADVEVDVDLDPDDDELDLPSEPAAAHARRTMIGRSAEEVDHAPPRGRYAPVPAPSGVTASATLRWAAPAAALALASAIVVGRALRRRR